MNLIIAGIQGSGKGTQSKLLADEFKLVHISFGDVIKWMLTEKPDIVAPYTLEKYNNGELADDEVLFRVARFVIDPILEKSDTYNGFILDGFPRTQGQLDFVMNNYQIDACVIIELPEEKVIERLMTRGRSDDNPEGIKRRLANYKTRTLPIFDNIPSDKIIKINGDKSVFEINIELSEKLKALNVQ